MNKIYNRSILSMINILPHEAVAEVSNHKEPIEEGGVQLVRKSIDVRFKSVASQMVWLSSDLRFKCFGCHLI